MTYIAPGSAAAKKIQNAALFSEAKKIPNLTNWLTGPAPKVTTDDLASMTRLQTDSGAPIIRVTDLEKGAGGEITMDLFHGIRGKPKMGDEQVEGRGIPLTQTQFTLRINQYMQALDAGGRMTQQRTAHDLLRIGKKEVRGYYGRLVDEIVVAHLAGARGDREHKLRNLPRESDPDFQKIMVNEVLPISFDRHWYGGDATSIDNLDAADIFTMESVDRIASSLEETDTPVSPVAMVNDKMAGEAPFHILYVTPKQFNDFWQSASGKDYRELAAAAITRGRNGYGMDHALFMGDCAFWRGILIRKLPQNYVMFKPGSQIKVSTNTDDAQVETKTAGREIHRAILLGSQALALAFGREGSGDLASHFRLTSKKLNHGNNTELCVAWMKGVKRIRWQDMDGRVNDHGCGILDTAVAA